MITTLSSDKVATYFPSILTTRFVWCNFFVSLHCFQRLSRLNKALGVTVCLCHQGGVRGRTRGGSLSSEWGWGGGRADGECSLPRLKLPEPTCPPPPPAHLLLLLYSKDEDTNKYDFGFTQIQLNCDKNTNLVHLSPPLALEHLSCYICLWISKNTISK